MHHKKPAGWWTTIWSFLDLQLVLPLVTYTEGKSGQINSTQDTFSIRTRSCIISTWISSSSCAWKRRRRIKWVACQVSIKEENLMSSGVVNCQCYITIIVIRAPLSFEWVEEEEDRLMRIWKKFNKTLLCN